MNGEQPRSVTAPSRLCYDAFGKHFSSSENLQAAHHMPPSKSAKSSVQTAWIAWLVVTTTLTMCLTPAGGTTIDFEELVLDPGENFYNGADGSGGFISREVEFSNTFTPSYGSWSGWSYSRETNNISSGFTNQYSAYPGGGASESEKYGIAFSSLGGAGSYPEIFLPPGKTPHSIKVANTTYAALSMLHGDAFSKKFGGLTGDAPDWFRLSVAGLNATWEPVGQVEHYLADYRSTDPAEDYVLDIWQKVDLSPLASPDVAILRMQLHSSDTGPFGMNTPAYFAVDDLVLADSAVLGDYNRTDGVDAADYTVWRDQLGDLVTPPGNGPDGNGNGLVDSGDYVVWKTSFETISGSGKTTVVTDVPEPTGFYLLAIGILTIFFYLSSSPRTCTS
jgi:hypothetical protein